MRVTMAMAGAGRREAGSPSAALQGGRVDRSRLRRGALTRCNERDKFPDRNFVRPTRGGGEGGAMGEREKASLHVGKGESMAIG